MKFAQKNGNFALNPLTKYRHFVKIYTIRLLNAMMKSTDFSFAAFREPAVGASGQRGKISLPSEQAFGTLRESMNVRFRHR
ncbi:MAG: hypothetical protein DBX59_03425 [Bacillota bacterium]|nr:MAG: hypothetical protein DBX59_03425 [Bacillota bacterium]